jgi:hypothetical protein
LLAINGARVTAAGERTLEFIAGLYDANRFRFEEPVRWLRDNVAFE